MAFENFSEYMSELDLQNIFSGDLSSFVPIFYLVMSIAVYSVLIWHFYRFIARRDCFKISEAKHSKLVGFAKYFFLFPFVASLFFIGFSMMMLFLTRNYEIPAVLSTSFAIILAIRIASYYSNDLSKDVAKMLPFALLGIFLVDPSYFRFEDVIDKIYSIPEFLVLCIQFVLFIIIVEWVLRIGLSVRYAIFPKKPETPDQA